MNARSPLRKSLIIVAALVTAGLAIGQFASFVDAVRNIFKPYDIVEYWAAGRLAAQGKNPYHAEQLHLLQKEAGAALIDSEYAIMMWNPPWILPIVMPLGLLPIETAQLSWFLLNLGSLLISVDLLWRMYGGPKGYRWVAWVLMLCFVSTSFLLVAGQVSGLVLLGFVGFIYFIGQEKPILAGLFASLTAIKPHFLALFALLFLLEAIRVKQTRRAAIVGLLILIACSLLPLIWVPQVWSHYWEASRGRSNLQFIRLEEWSPPTIGYQLRMAIPGQPFWVQFVPLACAVVLLGCYWWRSRESWDWVRVSPWLSLLFALTACYGAWAFDLVILLPAIIWSTVRVASSENAIVIASFAAIYMLLNLWGFATFFQPRSLFNIWISPLVLLGTLLAWRIPVVKRESTSSF